MRLTHQARLKREVQDRIARDMEVATHLEFQRLWRGVRAKIREINRLKKHVVYGTSLWELFQKRLHDRLEKIALDGFESLYLLEQEYQTEIGFEYNYELELERYKYELGKRITQVAQSTQKKVGERIKQWYSTPGESMAVIIADLSKEFELPRAQLIAQTEITRMNSKMQEGVAEYLGIQEWWWQTRRDHLVCTKPFVGPDGATYNGCRGLHGRVFSIEMTKPPDASHPGCVLPGQVVAVPALSGGAKSFYYGRVIEFSTAGGRKLSVTENHPVLTSKGYVAAQFINIGDYVIAHRRPERIVSCVSPDYQHVPAVIEKVFSALSMARGMFTGGVPASSEDLHGDGRNVDGDINIVYANRELTDTFNPSIGKPDNQFLFGGGGVVSFNKAGIGVLYQFFKSCGSAFSGFMSGCSLMLSSGIRHLRPFKGFGFALSSGSDITQDEVFSNGSSGNPVKACNFVFRNAVDITSDQIVNITVTQFKGHVYDLQSDLYSLYTVNGIIVSNCRCDPVLKRVPLVKKMIKVVRYSLRDMLRKSFQESEHPRDDDGRFGDKAGSSEGHPLIAEAKKQAPENVHKYLSDNLRIQEVALADKRLQKEFLSNGADVDKLGGDYAVINTADPKVVSKIKERVPEVKEEQIDAVIREWSMSSHRSVLATQIQASASRVLGAEESNFDKSRLELFKNEPITSKTKDEKSQIEFDEPAVDKIVKGMYEETQSKLRGMGFAPDDEITLYRASGMKGSNGNDYDINAIGKEVTFVSNALESWSYSPSVAWEFYDSHGGEAVVLSTKAKAKDVFSMATSGVGTLSEREVVLFGRGDRKSTLMLDYHKEVYKAEGSGELVITSDVPEVYDWLRMLGEKSVEKAEFVESEHPRANDGKFGDKNGSGKGAKGNVEIGRTINRHGDRGVAVYNMGDCSSLMDYNLICISRKDRTVLASKHKGNHADLIRTVDRDYSEDDYVRLSVVNGVLIADTAYAGIITNGDFDESKAIENIYKTLDMLVEKGLPKDTPVEIWKRDWKDGKIIRTTAKVVVSGDLLKAEFQESEHPRASDGRFGNKAGSGGATFKENIPGMEAVAVKVKEKFAKTAIVDLIQHMETALKGKKAQSVDLMGQIKGVLVEIADGKTKTKAGYEKIVKLMNDNLEGEDKVRVKTKVKALMHQQWKELMAAGAIKKKGVDVKPAEKKVSEKPVEKPAEKPIEHHPEVKLTVHPSWKMTAEEKKHVTDTLIEFHNVAKKIPSEDKKYTRIEALDVYCDASKTVLEEDKFNIEYAGKSVKVFSAKHFDAKYESGEVIDSQTGIVLEKQKGNEHRVAWNYLQVKSMEGNVLIHNHPSGAPLSGVDIAMAMRCKLKAIACTCNVYVKTKNGYEMKKGMAVMQLDDAWEGKRTSELEDIGGRILRDYKTMKTKIKPRLSNLVIGQNIDFTYGDTTFSRLLCSGIARIYGFKYSEVLL